MLKLANNKIQISSFYISIKVELSRIGQFDMKPIPIMKMFFNQFKDPFEQG